MKQKLLLLLFGALISLLPLRAEIITGDCSYYNDENNATFHLDTESGLLTIKGIGSCDLNKLSDYISLVKEIVFEEGIKYAGGVDGEWFAFVNLRKVYMPSTFISFHTSNINRQPFYNSKNLEYIDCSPLNEHLVSIDGVLFNKEQTKVIAYPWAVKKLTIPSTIEKQLQYEEFENLHSLQELTLGSLNGSMFNHGAAGTYNQGFGALFREDSTDFSGLGASYMKYFYKLPNTLKKLKLSCDTICLSDFNTYIYYDYQRNSRYYFCYYSYESQIDTVEINADTIWINKDQLQDRDRNGMRYCFGEPRCIKLNFKGTTLPSAEVLCGPIEELSLPNVKGMRSAGLASLYKLKRLVLPFPGAGSIKSSSNFGELFGKTVNSGKEVSQVMIDGTVNTYYMPADLGSLTITEGCGEVAYGCFYNCTMLKEVYLPSTTFSVGEKAFYGCAGLEDLYCAAEIPPVAYDNTFDGVRIATCRLHVPAGTADLYRRSPGWERFFEIIDDAEVAGIIETATTEPTQNCYGTHGGIKVTNAEGERVAVYSLQGQLLHNAIAAEQEETIGITPGIYIVRVGDRAEKVVVK